MGCPPPRAPAPYRKRPCHQPPAAQPPPVEFEPDEIVFLPGGYRAHQGTIRNALFGCRVRLIERQHCFDLLGRLHLTLLLRIETPEDLGLLDTLNTADAAAKEYCRGFVSGMKVNGVSVDAGKITRTLNPWEFDAVIRLVGPWTVTNCQAAIALTEEERFTRECNDLSAQKWNFMPTRWERAKSVALRILIAIVWIVVGARLWEILAPCLS